MINIEDYKNLFDHIVLESEEIENQIINYDLTFSNIKNDFVEWRMKFPMFLNSFYQSVYDTNTIPTQSDFWSTYLIKNESFFNEKSFSESTIEALKARAYRAYPSLVRDIHFVHYVKENMRDSRVIYNRTLDVEEGIDFMIVKNDKNYAVNLFTSTARAIQARAKKENRHKKYDNVIYIELPVNFMGSYSCGKFFLYKEQEYNNLLGHMNCDSN